MACDYESGINDERERILKIISELQSKYNEGIIGDVDEFYIKLRDAILGERE